MRARVLRGGEWGELPVSLAPFFEQIDTRGAAVILIEDGDEIVACAALLNLPHLEGAWISPSKRKNPAVGRMLLVELIKLLGQTEGWVLASTEDESIARLFDHLGAIPLPVSPEMKAFALDVKNREGAQWPLRRRLEEEVWAG